MTAFNRLPFPATWLALGVAACGAPPPQENRAVEATEARSGAEARAGPVPAPAPKTGAPGPAAAPRWDMAASGEGDAMFLAGADGKRQVTFFCPAETGDLVVN